MAVCIKKAWATERSARRNLTEIRRKRDRSRHGAKVEVRTYRCPACSAWHVTSAEAEYVLPSTRRRLRDREEID